MKRLSIAVIVLLALTACADPLVPSYGGGPINKGAVTGAATVPDLMRLGAHRVGPAEFNRRILGRVMTDVGGAWTWVINPDGTHAATAVIPPGRWSLQYEAFCTDGAEAACSDIWMIGPYLRMVPRGGRAAPWTVTVGE
jgi:hypothetical protein